jgi:hypothetical protein
MELSVDNALAAIANPSAELKSLLSDERTPQAAKDALAHAMNGSKSGVAADKGIVHRSSGDERDGRLQVVDEQQRFS